MFTKTKELIYQLRLMLKQNDSISGESFYEDGSYLRFNDMLEEIYEGINPYRAVKRPVLFEQKECYSVVFKQIEMWLTYAEENCISELELFNKKRANMLDKNFIELLDCIYSTPEDAMHNALVDIYLQIKPDIREWYANYYYTYKSYWGELDSENDNYEVIDLRIKSFHAHWEDLLWLYNKLKDYRSKKVLYLVLKNWLFFTDMREYMDTFVDSYFDYDIIKCSDEEVFVDLGAYVGDTALEYIKNFGARYRRIYCYDISAENLEQAKRNLSAYENIEYRLNAVSDKCETLRFDCGEYDSTNFITESGELEITAVSLDQDIEEKITFLKSDVEGFEQKVILGSMNHIINDKPKLAISIYHNNEDIWKIARMIDDNCPGYDFYIRYHGGLAAAAEFILMAVYNESGNYC